MILLYYMAIQAPHAHFFFLVVSILVFVPVMLKNDVKEFDTLQIDFGALPIICYDNKV